MALGIPGVVAPVSGSYWEVSVVAPVVGQLLDGSG